MTYSIKEVADMMNVEPSTLRYYDSMGLLPGVKRVKGRRVFEDKDFKWLRVLNCMKKINMPIDKIKAYVELAEKVVENVTSCSPTLEVDTIPKNKKEGK